MRLHVAAIDIIPVLTGVLSPLRSSARRAVEKLDNVTWYGHCVIHVLAAINDLPDEAKLVFCRDLEKFIKRQERVLSKA
jgi:hypothetical protein